ncbi:probable indole-3-pyruvate monooxygenase YUCCA11 [Actinidia eriantha]|uniref:probable indole-3-pyruvate monooxygenase YUCCA11 n=1 Tax=Actinidia eriantha TaxID=165200 RepID=UPI0025898C61|nr:probable indole-3-pyruvate monooxygenase YUCCA11 [Actinidia eriantha]
MAQETVVVIVGAGPAGIATSACLNRLSIPNVVLEREDCCASLWKKRSYDRLKLHLANHYCQLPNMPFPDDAPMFVSKSGFIRYLDNYVSGFKVCPLFGRFVGSAVYEGWRWRVEVVSGKGTVEVFVGQFLVVATGENSEAFVPKVVGLEGFGGGVLHSCEYVNGERFRDKDVLVVGSGNSGMEIAFDLSNYGVRTAISIRSPVHVLTKEMVQRGMYLLKWLPCSVVDWMVQSLGKLKYGDISQYGIQTPTKGPFYLKRTAGRSPVIDVGTIDKIKTGEIRVFPSLSHIKGDIVEFASGKALRFDAIVFATGYRTTVRKWLKDDGDLFNNNGMPKRRAPDHWKGNNGLYCAGFSSSGLFGISQDAENIAKDISMQILNQ